MLRPAAPARALRGALVAVVGLGIATAGHVYAGGSAAPTPLVVLVALLVTAASMLASRSRWTASRLALVLLGMQVAVHAALWFETGSREVDGRLAALAASGTTHAHTAGTGSSSVSMVVAHVVAVVVAAVLIAAIDGAVWLLLALARRILRTAAGIAAPVLRLRAVVLRRAVATGVLELGAVGRRGPPVVAAPA